MNKSHESRERIWGLDTLRFIAALWVLFSHCGYFPLTEGIDRNHPVGYFVRAIYGNLFPGVPAVIVFFLISGFCIHYPFRGTGTFELMPYLVRRYLRIGIPLLVAVGLARAFGVKLALFHNSILWTLLAELIYYTLYPLIRRLRARFGWGPLIGVSYVVAFFVILTNPSADDFSAFGAGLNWLIALPSWLLGCRLAEVNFAQGGLSVSRSIVWGWRLGVWFLCWLSSVLYFHSPVGYPWTVNVFAIAVFFWLKAEITSFRTARGPRLWEWAGQWSYSIYLMHSIADSAYQRVPAVNLGFNLNWVQKYVFIFAFSYVFYLLVEKPGHWIARTASRRVRKREPVAVSTGGSLSADVVSSPAIVRRAQEDAAERI